MWRRRSGGAAELLRAGAHGEHRAGQLGLAVRDTLRGGRRRRRLLRLSCRRVTAGGRLVGEPRQRRGCAEGERNRRRGRRSRRPGWHSSCGLRCWLRPVGGSSERRDGRTGGSGGRRGRRGRRRERRASGGLALEAGVRGDGEPPAGSGTQLVPCDPRGRPAGVTTHRGAEGRGRRRRIGGGRRWPPARAQAGGSPVARGLRSGRPRRGRAAVHPRAAAGCGAAWRTVRWPPAARGRWRGRCATVAAQASSTFAREGAQRLGALGGIPLVVTCDRGTFACRPTGEDGGEDS